MINMILIPTVHRLQALLFINTFQQIQEEDYNIEQLEEREKAIRQLESDIVDVNTIFKDLATMVHEQVQFYPMILAIDTLCPGKGFYIIFLYPCDMLLIQNLNKIYSLG